ncbi:MAG: hypothetical protein QOI78_7597 [Actinomycetota bacterium]|nr:hypothetical protein [Actinomycetota bacterium]
MPRRRFAALKRDDAEQTLRRAARIGYPVYLLGVVAVFMVAFG